MALSGIRYPEIVERAETGDTICIEITEVVKQVRNHLMKCNKRNVNDCKKCKSSYEAIRGIHNKATQFGVDTVYASIADAATVMYHERIKK